MIVASMFVMGCGPLCSAGDCQMRIERSNKMRFVKKGMTRAKVLLRLGKPDIIRMSKNELIDKIWCYGATDEDEFPIFGQVYFDQNEKVFIIAGGSGTPPKPEVIQEKDLKKLLRLIDKAPSFYSEKNYISDGYNPLPVVQIVNALQSSGKEKALAAILEYLRVAPSDSEAREGLFLVLRVLFEIPNPPGHMPLLPIGSTIPEYTQGDKLLPRYPILLKDSIPFYLVISYAIEGERIPVEAEIPYFKKFGVLRKNLLVPPDNPLSVLNKIRKSHQWIFGIDEKMNERGKLLVMHQLLLLINSVYPTKTDSKTGRKINGGPDLDQRWKKIQADVRKLDIRWDKKKNDYVINKQ